MSDVDFYVLLFHIVHTNFYLEEQFNGLPR